MDGRSETTEGAVAALDTAGSGGQVFDHVDARSVQVWSAIRAARSGTGPFAQLESWRDDGGDRHLRKRHDHDVLPNHSRDDGSEPGKGVPVS